MFHRIQADLARTHVPLVLPPLACVLRVVLDTAPVRSSAALRDGAARTGDDTPARPQPPYAQPRPVTLAPRSRPYVLDEERHARRTAMRLALDGIVVRPGIGHPMAEVAA